MLATTRSVALVGTEARIVDVEIHVGQGLPTFSIVGLPERSVREAEQRMRGAIGSSELEWPQQRKTANLAPGHLRKDGTHFDLALALGLLAASNQVAPEALAGWVIIGELGLDGSVRAARGALSAATAARDGGYRGLICPAINSAEAALIDSIEVVPVEHLMEAHRFFTGEWEPGPVCVEQPTLGHIEDDIADVRGHADAKRVLEIGACGAHNLLMHGPPGSGKTMLARRYPGLLPVMTLEEALEVTRIHSVAGLTSSTGGIVGVRPFRVPHHSTSMAGLLGGGIGLARPGEVSLAHHGCLFLDELGLYPKHILEALRAPLEDGEVRIARSAGSVSYPSRFSLIAAMNPCPCGYLGDPVKQCRCGEGQISAYQSRLSGPLLDRFDMQITVERVSSEEILGDGVASESSQDVRARVERCRAVQHERYGSSLYTNASVPRRLLLRTLGLERAARRELSGAIDGLCLSGRGVDRVMRVGRTLADMHGSAAVTADHIAEAVSLRAGADLREPAW